MKYYVVSVITGERVCEISCGTYMQIKDCIFNFNTFDLLYQYSKSSISTSVKVDYLKILSCINFSNEFYTVSAI